MKDVFGNSLIERLNLNRRFVGHVMDNSEWYEEGCIRVFIKELFPVFNDIPELYSSSESINSSNIKNEYVHNISDVKTSTGLKARGCMINRVRLMPLEGEKVFVEFLDGDIKKPIYYMMDYSDGVPMLKNKNLNIKIIGEDIIIERGNAKIKIDDEGIKFEGKIFFNGMEVSDVSNMEE